MEIYAGTDEEPEQDEETSADKAKVCRRTCFIGKMSVGVRKC